MSLSCQHLFVNSLPRLSLYISSSSSSTKLLSLPIRPRHPQFPNPITPTSFNLRHSRLLRVHDSDVTLRASDDIAATAFTLDHFLAIAEFLCLVSSGVVSIGFAVSATGSKAAAFAAVGNRAVAVGAAALVAAVWIGAWIRRRQWSRVCRESAKGGTDVNLFERIEKLEQDVRTSATIIKVLSRQLEKLGIRFRVTRKALKEPIAETAALAQKNSEATRALAVQEDVLEKELEETQKVLLAMQEQQQKQLDLILAIAKSGKLLDKKQTLSQAESVIREPDSSNDNTKQKETHQV